MRVRLQTDRQTAAGRAGKTDKTKSEVRTGPFRMLYSPTAVKTAKSEFVLY